jgi:hypothetical protein
MFELRVLLAGTLIALAPLPLAAQRWESSALSRADNGERELRVDVEYGAGQLTVEPAAEGTLFRAALRYDANSFEPRMSYDDGRLRVGINNAEVRGRNVKGGSLSLHLSPDALLDLDLAFGAAEAKLELGGLHLNSLEISTGASTTVLSFSQPNAAEAESIELQVGAARLEARGLGNARTERLSVEGGVGEIDLDFSGAWTRDMHATVGMGLGKLILRLPRGLGVRIEKDGLLASIEGDGLNKRDDVYYTTGFEAAARKLTMEIDAAFNTIQIIWVGNLQADAR